MVRLTDRLDMTIVVDWDVKQHSNKHMLPIVTLQKNDMKINRFAEAFQIWNIC